MLSLVVALFTCYNLFKNTICIKKSLIITAEHSLKQILYQLFGFRETHHWTRTNSLSPLKHERFDGCSHPARISYLAQLPSHSLNVFVFWVCIAGRFTKKLKLLKAPVLSVNSFYIFMKHSLLHTQDSYTDIQHVWLRQIVSKASI